jgi:hypothetical protein
VNGKHEQGAGDGDEGSDDGRCEAALYEQEQREWPEIELERDREPERKARQEPFLAEAPRDRDEQRERDRQVRGLEGRDRRGPEENGAVDAPVGHAKQQEGRGERRNEEHAKERGCRARREHCERGDEERGWDREDPVDAVGESVSWKLWWACRWESGPGSGQAAR